MFLKPGKPDLLVRHPLTKRKLKADGEEIQLNSYWRRRLKCGDVIEVKSSGASKAPVKLKKDKGD